MKFTLIAGLAVSFGVVLTANAVQPPVAQQSTQQSTPKVKVGAAVTAKANSPTPPAAAKNKSEKASIGKGKLAVKASQPSSFWTEEIDLEDDGTVESTDFLYDASRGIVYAYREDDFTCPNGQAARGSVLEIIYAKGNKAGRPVGSGAYLVELSEGKCGAKKSGEFGCKFDGNGNATECGAATINYATGEIDVAVVQ
jgi:hypothetical protein